MNPEHLHRHQLRNTLQSMLLVGVMAALCAYLAWLIGGTFFAALTLGLVSFALALNPMASPDWIMALYRGQEISSSSAPKLHAVAAALARRAGLSAVPTLYYLPSQVMNAFATGNRDQAAIALSDGLLRRLDLREAANVLAHEITHIANNDIRVMAFADLTSRMTNLLAMTGQFLLILNLPLILFSDFHFDWLMILVLLAAPMISALAQLALSRNREYDADLGASELTGDPEGLALALQKMERYQGRVLEQILFPGQKIPDPSLLRSHPPTRERIARLLAIRDSGQLTPSIGMIINPQPLDRLSRLLAAAPIRPRWHRNGLWY